MKRKILVQRFCMTIAAFSAVASTSGVGWGDGTQKKAGARTTATAATSPTAPPASVDTANRKAATDAYEQAKIKFENEEFGDAAVSARKAWDKDPQPQYGLYLARSLAESDHVLEAIRIYEEVSKMTPPKGASTLYKKAVELAGQELPGARKRIAKLQISQPAESSEDTQILVDGLEYKPGALVETDPGQHHIEVRWGAPATQASSSEAGSASVKLDVSLKEGSMSQVTSAVPRPAAPPPEPIGTGMVTPPYPPSDCRSVRCGRVGGPALPPESAKTSFDLLGALSMGAGVAGLGVGAAAGIAAMVMTDDLKKQCPDGHCRAESRPVGTAAEGLANLSTVGFAVGAGGVVAGTLLFVVPRITAKGKGRVEIGPTVGGVVAKGEF